MVFGLFNTQGSKKITQREFEREVRQILLNKGLSHQDIDRVELALGGHLFETGMHSGIDRKEIEQLIKTLKATKSSHSLSDKQIDTVEQVLREELKD